MTNQPLTLTPKNQKFKFNFEITLISRRLENIEREMNKQDRDKDWNGYVCAFSRLFKDVSQVSFPKIDDQKKEFEDFRKRTQSLVQANIERCEYKIKCKTSKTLKFELEKLTKQVLDFELQLIRKLSSAQVDFTLAISDKLLIDLLNRINTFLIGN